MTKEFFDDTIPIQNQQLSDYEMLRLLLSETFDYFLLQMNPENGLVSDKSSEDSPASIAVSGIALSVFIVGAEIGLISREEAIVKTLSILKFFYHSHQGSEEDATGYRGFYYHFLDMKTGCRTWNCELSTMDTALLIAGALSAACYFTSDDQSENEIRFLVKKIYERVDWPWALNGGTTLTHGWKPKSGFLPYRWSDKYNEAFILYVLALGSPTFPIEADGYKEWTSTFEWTKIYDIEYFYAGPLFIHQLSHVWLDFRGIKDDANRKYGIDYFENSRRATYVHQKYAIENPRGFADYGKNAWGITASYGPGPTVLQFKDREIEFYGYLARGAPFGPDDGTISPWAVVASFPFAPEIVCSTVRHAIEQLQLKHPTSYGFYASFNSSFPKEKHRYGWVAPWRFGLNQGPLILMIENGHTGLLWNLMKKCDSIKNGLLKAGFRGGWLET
ncbi:MAG: glucoamylase family protein [Pseudobdellovibrionaceae bacterium]